MYNKCTNMGGSLQCGGAIRYILNSRKKKTEQERGANEKNKMGRS
jgi:hypothetical protein